MKKVRRTQAVLDLPALTLEGGLFLPDQLEKAALGSGEWQTEADYGTPKGLKLKDDYSRAFQIACAQWKHFAAHLDRSDVDAVHLTQTFVLELLRDAFGYTNLQPCNGIIVAGRHYPVNFIAGNIPVIVAPHTLALKDADAHFAVEGSGSKKKSPFLLAQEFLNASTEHLWAIACNGKTLRLLRDAATLTRPSFLEIDLQDLLGGQRYAEFANVWRLLHVSRSAGEPGDCIWEKWRAAGQEEGTRVREGLRQGVTEALRILGEGFLQHPANDALRNALHNGELSKEAWFQQLLRLIYRLIFLFSVEERGLLHGKDDSKTAQAARRAYAEGYALARLRERCLKRRAKNRFEDHWQAIRIVFKGLSEGEPLLALPALGGLFATNQCPALDAASLDNAHLLATLQSLRWASHNSVLAPVDYRNMGPEELGSVYESLLELVPEIDLPARRFGFVGITSEGSTAGNARKLTGSYYTPDSLVQELIKSALDPVIANRLAAQPDAPIEALLALRVIDPACGSGHFLLAAARRLAEKLAQLRATDSEQSEQDFRHALREVVAKCIFGVDRNPMAIELARTALWLEGFEEGRPLSFLDHHLQVGDALLGLIDLNVLEQGIAKDAFKPLSGDDKDVCKQLAKNNAAELKDLEKKRASPQFQLNLHDRSSLSALQSIEALPENTTRQIAAKEAAWRAFLEQARTSRLAHAADLLVGAYLLPKLVATQNDIPTSAALYLTLQGDALPSPQRGALAAAQSVCVGARVLHWPLAFPQVFAGGGFDCVLGNPPWERIKLQEEEFFATRHRDVAEAKNKAERAQRIQWLSEGMLARHLFPELKHADFECAAEQRLYREFIVTRRTAEASSLFAHVKGEDGGRYPLTGVGDVNTYALFAETISQIAHVEGRAGFIVPTGIATDDSTKAYFAHITQSGRLVSLYDIENRDKLFAAVDSRMKFCLLTLGKTERAEFVCFATQTNQLADPRRRFTLTPDEFRLINPNTLTCPVFRSEHDAELTKKLYCATQVLVDETQPNGNPWKIQIRQGLFHLTNDINSGIVIDALTAKVPEFLIPVVEGKSIHQFDHRWATYTTDGDNRDVSEPEKANPDYTVIPRYWVASDEVEERLIKRDHDGSVIWHWDRNWLIGWRDICRATDERTVIASVVPRVGIAYTMRVAVSLNNSPARAACLLSNLNSLVCDFVARQVLGGTHLSDYIIKQFPILPPDRYTDADLAFIVPRVLELTFTAHDLAPWAQDLGYDGPPFAFDPERRTILRAELDAWYAKLYGLTRDELRYILDPADVLGEDYPSETFRVLKNKEIKAFGEYRTQRLVLREFDRMALAEANGEPYTSTLIPPPGEQAQPSYSLHGIIRNEIDARLAGLLLSLIRQARTLPRQHITFALTVLQNEAQVSDTLPAAEKAQLLAYCQSYPQMPSDYIERLPLMLRFFETSGAIRIQQQGALIEAIAGATSHGGVVVETENEAIASILLQITRSSLERQEAKASDTASSPAMKRA